jgi:DNA-binding PadR family transcriptional regulator
MKAIDLARATGLPYVSVSVTLMKLVGEGYAVEDGPKGPYRITAKGKEALGRRIEGERIVKEVIPKLKKAIDLGLTTRSIRWMIKAASERAVKTTKAKLKAKMIVESVLDKVVEAVLFGVTIREIERELRRYELELKKSRTTKD